MSLRRVEVNDQCVGTRSHVVPSLMDTNTLPDRSVAGSPLDPRAVWPDHEPAIGVKDTMPGDVPLQGKAGDGHTQPAVAGRCRQWEGGTVSVGVAERHSRTLDWRLSRGPLDEGYLAEPEPVESQLINAAALT
jgi:hypothetical protein